MSRLRLFLIWVMCLLATVVLVVAMLCHTLFGSKTRALYMALALDGCGNALFGGLPTMTISERVGNALLEGRWFAKPVAFCIDLFFGRGHCLSHATANKPADKVM